MNRKKNTVDTCRKNLFKYFIQRQDFVIENGEFNKSFPPQKNEYKMGKIKTDQKQSSANQPEKNKKLRSVYS